MTANARRPGADGALPDLLHDVEVDRVALHCDDATVAYGELAARSAALAGGLERLGIGRGDRVGLWLPNGVAWIELFFACARLGAIAVSVNTRFRSHEIGDIVRRSGCRVLAFAPGYRAIDFGAILSSVPRDDLSKLEAIVTCDAAPDAVPVRDIPAHPLAALADGPAASGMRGGADDRCVIFTTSGTTSAPKFVCHDQRTIVRHARDVAAALELDHDEAVLLQALPLCGVFGFVQAMAALAAACPMVVLPGFDAASAAAAIIRHRVTHMNGVDDMIDGMLASRPEPQPFPSLRHFGYARFNPALEDVADSGAARGVCVRGLYGMSECQAFYALQPATLPIEQRRKGGGAPVSSEARVRVRDPQSGELLAPGAHGELEISGPSLMREYYGDAAATRAAFTADGYLRTGDLAYLESDGRFCYVARMGDAMRLGGFLTSPEEIEAVLDSHPGIRASQVVAAEVDGRPAAIAFCIVEDAEAARESDVIAYCRERLAGYKVPARLFVLDAFPTTASANGTKIKKSKLRSLAYDLLINAD